LLSIDCAKAVNSPHAGFKSLPPTTIKTQGNEEIAMNHTKKVKEREAVA